MNESQQQIHINSSSISSQASQFQSHIPPPPQQQTPSLFTSISSNNCSNSNLTNLNNISTTNNNNNNNNNTRPKLYKIKRELDDYNALCIDHKDPSIAFFDYYMEFTPTIMKRIFIICFFLNKILVLLLVYCVFYNTIWWINNSTSNNLAINYQIIDSNIFIILVYINIHDVAISGILLKSILFNIIKSFHITSTIKLKSMLNTSEAIIQYVFILLIFYYLYYKSQYTFVNTFLFLLPHIYFLFHNNYDYEIKFLNRILFTNNYQNLINNKKHLQSQSTATATATTMLFSNGGSSTAAQIQQQSSTISGLNTTPTTTTTTTPTTNLISETAQQQQTTTSNSNLIKSIRTSILKYTQLIRSIPQTSHIKISKHFLFTQQISANSMCNTYVQHRCSKDTISLREETDYFRYLYNCRFKEVCYKTFEIVFYNLIIPRLIVPQHLNVRNFEYYSYVFVIISSTFLSYWLYYMPLSFIISLQRNAEHLGRWSFLIQYSIFNKKSTTNQKINGTSNVGNGNATMSDQSDGMNRWFETKFYYKGDCVIYKDNYYQVVSDFCVSIPDYKPHQTYYKYFSDPFRIVTLLVILKLFYIVLLGLVTYREAKWYNVAVNMLYVILNFHTLYIVTRDWIILYVRKYVKLYQNYEKTQ